MYLSTSTTMSASVQQNAPSSGISSIYPYPSSYNPSSLLPFPSPHSSISASCMPPSSFLHHSYLLETPSLIYLSNSFFTSHLPHMSSFFLFLSLFSFLLPSYIFGTPSLIFFFFQLLPSLCHIFLTRPHFSYFDHSYPNFKVKRSVSRSSRFPLSNPSSDSYITQDCISSGFSSVLGKKLLLGCWAENRSVETHDATTSKKLL